MSRSRNLMHLGAALAFSAAAHMDADPGGWPTDYPKQRRRSPPYVPPEPSPDLIAERIRAAEAKRARKAAKAIRQGGEG